MIRQNLLVIVFVLLSATGCSMVPQSGGSCCPDQCATAKPCPLKHRAPKKSKCRCKHCAHHAPLFPGDAYGQYNAGYMPGQPMMMPSAFGSCGSECSDCGGQNFDSGFSSGGMEMDGMPSMPGMHGGSSGGCNCGGESMSGSMPGSEYPMMMPSAEYPPSAGYPPSMDLTPQPHPQTLPQPHGKSAPLAPAESFEAPGTRNNGMPPVPQDPAGDMPPATPAVDPVSWQFPAQSRVSPQLPYPGRNNPARRVEQIPTGYQR